MRFVAGHAGAEQDAADDAQGAQQEELTQDLQVPRPSRQPMRGAASGAETRPPPRPARHRRSS
ncbi:hypothetical protein AQF52_7295 [Streptomyces venezuelae]|nr:hypothetical protein AQF52_7295 [Streptomyces venezuelae]CUM36461.1 hypothetical protein BN2537_1887 [Streptomyces venezuelae]